MAMTLTTMGQRAPVTGSILLVLVMASTAVGVARLRQSDVRWGRRVFDQLTQGDASVERRIAWDRLQALGNDVGATYRALPETERPAYRRAFLAGCARGFAQSGAQPEAFTKWRVQGRRDGQAVVAADYAAKRQTLLLGVSTTGRKQLESLQWE